MPAFDKYVDPNDDVRSEPLEWINFTTGNERAERLKAHKKAQKYYERKQEKYLDLKEDEPDDNVVLNNYRIIVDRMAGLLFPKMPVLELTREGTEPTPEEKWLTEAWNTNNALSTMIEASMNGAFSGQVYARVRPNPKDVAHPKITLIDPSSIITYWKWDDASEVVFHEQLWKSPYTDETYLIDYVNQDNTWLIKSWKRDSGTKWVQAAPDTPWLSPWGPVASWKHLPFPNSHYGLSEATALELGDTINLVMSEALRINRYHAAPKTVAIGVDAQEIVPTAIDGLWAIAKDKTEADVFNLEFSAPAAAYTLGLLQMLQEFYLAEARAVMLKGDIKDFQRVTNPGIRTVFMEPLIKNEILREHYTGGIQQLSMAMAYASGKRLSLLPTVIWSDPLPSDDRELATIAKDELEMGIVSKTEISKQRGYSFPEQMALMLKEAEFTQQIMRQMGLPDPNQDTNQDQNTDNNQDNSGNQDNQTN